MQVFFAQLILADMNKELKGLRFSTHYSNLLLVSMSCLPLNIEVLYIVAKCMLLLNVFPMCLGFLELYFHTI